MRQNPGKRAWKATLWHASHFGVSSAAGIDPLTRFRKRPLEQCADACDELIDVLAGVRR
jgi:hypothetical protein